MNEFYDVFTKEKLKWNMKKPEVIGGIFYQYWQD